MARDRKNLKDGSIVKMYFLLDKDIIFDFLYGFENYERTFHDVCDA